jgi:hypothetical protein
MNDDRSYWLDDERNRNSLFWGLVVVCGLLLVAELFVHRHAHFGWEALPFFHAFVGFVAFWCIVIAGKHLRKILMRDEDYYD